MKRSIANATEIGRVRVHLEGKIETQLMNEDIYFLTRIEEYNRSMEQYPTKCQMEAPELFHNFITRFENRSGHEIVKRHAENCLDLTRAYQDPG